jgi:hypothetical protein
MSGMSLSPSLCLPEPQPSGQARRSPLRGTSQRTPARTLYQFVGGVRRVDTIRRRQMGPVPSGKLIILNIALDDHRSARNWRNCSRRIVRQGHAGGAFQYGHAPICMGLVSIRLAGHTDGGRLSRCRPARRRRRATIGSALRCGIATAGRQSRRPDSTGCRQASRCTRPPDR